MNVNGFAAITRSAIAEGDVIDWCAIGIWSTHESFAYISTLRTANILNAFSAGRTIGIRLTFECQTTSFIVWITDVAAAAGAMESAFVVGAKGARAAWSIATKIDSHTLCVRIAAEARLTIANWSMIFGCAQRLLAARLVYLARQFAQILFAELIRCAIGVGLAFDATATKLRITNETGFARAHSIMISRCTFGISTAQNTTFTGISAIRATVRIGDAIFVDQTILVRATSNLFRANVILTELEIGATRVTVTRRLADTLQTQLITDAIAIRCADGAADASIANRSRRTLVIVAAVLNRYASEQRIAGGARLTRTNANVIFDNAI